MRLGVIGLSEGNGHPFSFSAIVNGYDPTAFAAADWPVILDYLSVEPDTAFGFSDVKVTHAWTQDPALTATLCKACRIEHAVERLDDMLGAVDAVLLVRDDWERHAEMALPFLEHGTPVFVDKPLALDPGELARLAPHLEAGRLMSTSGLRYSERLADLKARLPGLGELRLANAVVVNELERYGVHMLDAAAGLGLASPAVVTRIGTAHQAYAIELADGLPMVLHCLGSAERTFRLDVYGREGHGHADLLDNFAAFRHTLDEFLRMVRDREPPIPPDDVLRSMTLIRLARGLAPGDSVRL